MQVTIGIKHASRELSLETSDSQEKVLAAVADAETKAVILSDDKGRKVFVPAGSLAYIELGEAEPRGVGFGICARTPRRRRRPPNGAGAPFVAHQGPRTR